MNDDATGNTTTLTVIAEEEAVAPAAQVPKRKTRAKAKPQEIKEPETPRAERSTDPTLLWAAVLKTQRAMEKETRSSKLSSLRIV